MQVTIVDIAKKLKLSHATVSRVLNKREDRFISAATRQRVLQTSQEMGYRPNLNARALVTGRTNRIAFWSPGMGERYFQELAYHFHQVLRKRDYQLIVGEIGKEKGDPFSEWGFSRQDVDGVIMFTGGLGKSLKSVLEQKLPAMAPGVIISPHYVGSLDFVCLDIYSASMEAMGGFIRSGRKRIAHVLTVHTQVEHDGRYRAYGEVMNEAGLEPAYVIVPQWTKDSSRKTIKEWIKDHGRPDALFCANDELAIGVYRGLCDLGIRVPEEVALVGCDGIEETEYLEVPLSTIFLDMKAMCETAWEFLHRRMENPDLDRQRVDLKAKFIKRESC